MKTRKTCKYSRHKCTRLPYRNYRHCFQHILEDKMAPFTTCQYISKTTKRRCHSPALKNEHSLPAFCEFHQQPQVLSQKTKHKPALRYDDREATSEIPGYKVEKLQEFPGSYKLDNNQKASDFDVKANSNWATTVSSNWKSSEADIDAESCDEEDYPLNNAGVYSLEEVVTVSQQRLIKLQSLYIKQFNQLRRELQEKRRKLILDESTTQIKPQHKDKASKHQDEKQREFSSLINYRRHNWENQLLYRNSKRRRMRAMPGSSSSHHEAVSSNKAKCSHVTNHIRCKNSCLPYTKYCITHIFEDPLQVLYKKCSNKSCDTPVCLLLHAPKQSSSNTPVAEVFCHLHHHLPPISDDLASIIGDITNDTAQIFKPSRSTSEVDSHMASGNVPVFHSHSESQPSTSSEGKIIHVTNDPVHTETDPPRNTPTSQRLHDESSKDSAHFRGGDEEEMEVDQVQKHDSNLPDTSHEKTLEKQSLPGEDVQEISRLSSSDLEQFKTGQCFLMNKISVYDEEEHRCMPAIHLEPIDSGSAENKSNSISETQSPPSAAPVTESVSSASESFTNKGETLSSHVRHRGMIMSVEKEDAERDSSVLKRKISSVTLVPPVEQNVSHETKFSDKEDTPQRDVLLQKMPPLALIVSKSSEDVSSSTNLDPSINTQDKELHPADCESVEKCSSPEISPTVEKKSVARSLESQLPTVNVQHSTETPSDDSSNENCDNKGGDVGEVFCSGNDRKPSSADEETAIASLLFLSSGTLQNH